MPSCLPEAADCTYRGLTWFDWAWSIFKKQCESLGWLGSINDNTSIAPFGTQALIPTYAQIEVSGAEQTVTIAAGATLIQAVIDDEYAADFALIVVEGGVDKALPDGCDLLLPAITPLFTADANGQAVTQGHGVYPITVVKYPIGAKGFVTAIYKGTATAIAVV